MTNKDVYAILICETVANYYIAALEAHMKKTVSLLLALIMMTGLLSGCGSTLSSDHDRLSIVATIFPEYDWVRQILGKRADEVNLKLLLDNGSDLHSYQPSVDDLVRIAECDLFIYVGGTSDSWIEDALKNASKEDRVVIRLLDVLGDSVKEEELVEGMETEEDEPDDGPEYDEHVWLSLRNAALFCDVIADKLGALDSAHRSEYAANAKAYIQQISALDEEFAAAVGAASTHTLLFGDRFPFRYLTDDYGLDYYAAFIGCSAETEASFETIAFLAGKLNALDLNVVLTIETGDGSIAQAIIDASGRTDVETLSLNSMQSINAKAAQDSEGYLTIMRDNLEVIITALR